MKVKKTFEIKDFEKNKNIYYNFQAGKKLCASNGVEVASFTYEDDETRPLNIPDGVSNIYWLGYCKQYYKDAKTSTHRLLLFGDDNCIYYNLMFKYSFDFKKLLTDFETKPIVLSYKIEDDDAVIFASKNKMFVWRTNYDLYEIKDAPIITSMCANEGVLFCTLLEPAYKIWYCSDLNPENVGNTDTTSGYILLDDDLGYARKAIVFDEDVYIIRDYGITKINNYKEHKTVSMIYQSNTLIFSNTVSVNGNAVLFFTKEGLYKFNGAKVEKTSVNINTLIGDINQNAIASSLGDKYYLATKLDFCDDKKILCEQNNFLNNVLIIIDTQTYDYQIIRGVDIVNFLPLKTDKVEQMLMVVNGERNIVTISKNSVYFDKKLPKMWKNSNIFENFSKKLVTKLSVYADKDIKITINFDDKQLSFMTKNSGLNQFNFKRVCNVCGLTIESENSSANIQSLEMEYCDC